MIGNTDATTTDNRTTGDYTDESNQSRIALNSLLINHNLRYKQVWPYFGIGSIIEYRHENEVRLSNGDRSKNEEKWFDVNIGFLSEVGVCYFINRTFSVEASYSSSLYYNYHESVYTTKVRQSTNDKFSTVTKHEVIGRGVGIKYNSVQFGLSVHFGKN